jgi:hypothetical protein
MQKLMHNPFGANRVSDPIAVTFWRSRLLLEAIERPKSPSWLDQLKLKKEEEEFSAANDLGESLANGQSLMSRKFKELKLIGALESALEHAPEGTLESM